MVLTHTLRSRWKGILGYSIGNILLLIWVTAAFPILRDSEELTNFVDNFPPQMQALLSIDPDTFLTAAGYLQAQYYALFGPLIIMFFVIGGAAAATAAEERDGTMDMLISMPVSRASLAVQKFTATAAGSLLIVAATAVGLLLLNPVFDLRLKVTNVIAVHIAMWLLVMLYGAIALAAGSFTGRPVAARSAAGGLAFIGWLVTGFAPLYSWLDGPSTISPFTWYADENPLLNSWGTGHLWLAISTAAVFAVGVYLFQKRDIGTERATLPRWTIRFGRSTTRQPRAVGLLTSVYRKSLWDRRNAVWGWAAIIALLLLVTFAAWPALSEDADALAALITALPREVFAMLGMTDPEALTTPAGFISSRAYLSIGPIVMVMFAVTGVASAVVKAEASGSLDLLLSNPVDRRSVILSKSLGILTLTGVIVVINTAVAIYGNVQWDTDLALGHIIAANVGLGLLGLCFGGLALALWALEVTRLSATRLAGVIAIATFFINGIGSLVEPLGPLRAISPFFWYLGDVPPLAKGFEPAYLLLAAVAVLGTWLAAWRVPGRDLAT